MCLATGEVEWPELAGNSNRGTSVAFLTQLREKHPGPLRVIWDNAPAHCGEAVREYRRTPELELRLVNPRFHEGRLCRATARTSTPLRLAGAGRERRPLAICAWAAGRRCRACPCVGRGEGRQIPGRAVQPERRGETALPDDPAIKGRNTPARLPPRFPAPGKCTSHLGFGLGPFPLEYALYRIPVSPARHSRASGNPELEVTFQYRQDHLETVLETVLETGMSNAHNCPCPT